jgi:threonine aldolase
MQVDLRSDTVTRPTEAMREAIRSAEVGDDVYGEDPTAIELQERVADLLGKEAGLFVSSGTMGNQIALLCHTSRGDELYTGQGSHCVWFESGAASAWSGVQPVEVGSGGTFTAVELQEALKPKVYWGPNPRLVVIENTHNRGGGKVHAQSEVLEIAEVARAKGLALHLDGARLWNAAVASGRSERELASPFDTATVCFSKGLGAPVGSVLVGSRGAIERARRFRKMLGGGMRQVGILGRACVFALENHRPRLAQDHVRAKRLAERAGAIAGIRVQPPETNIAMLDLDVDAARVSERLASRGVLINPFGPKRLRAVTHFDVDDAGIDAAIVALEGALDEVRA